MASVAEVRRAVDEGLVKIAESQAASQTVTKGAEELPVSPVSEIMKKAAAVCLELATRADGLLMGTAADTGKAIKAEYVTALTGTKNDLIDQTYDNMDKMGTQLDEAGTAAAAYAQLLRGAGETILGVEERTGEADAHLQGVTAGQEEVIVHSLRAVEALQTYTANL